MQTSTTIAKLSPALVAALGEIEGAAKKAKNPHFKSTYADLATVIDASRDILTAHKLTVIQGLGEMVENRLSCTTRILHESGEWIESTMQIPLGPKLDPQAAGSASTYIRRYSLMAMLNMPAVDDDGNAASGKAPVQKIEKNGTGPAPEGPDWWGADGNGPTAHAAKKDGLGERFEEIRNDIKSARDELDLKAACKTNHDVVLSMPKSWRVALRGEADEQALELGCSLSKRAA